jgi:multidrug resistance efflux pump
MVAGGTLMDTVNHAGDAALPQRGSDAAEPTDAATFWQQLAETAANRVDAMACLVFVRPDANTEWRAVSIWPRRPGPGSDMLKVLNQPDWPKQVVEAEGRWVVPLTEDVDSPMGLGVMTTLPSSPGIVVLLAAHVPVTQVQAGMLLDRMAAVIAGAPVFHLQRLLQQARTDVVQFSNVLDLLALLNEREKYVDACMALSNELTSRLRADRASIGWLKKGYIRVQAISHMEKFEKKMDAVQLLEAAMEEALEQDCEVVWPAGKDDSVVARDTQRYVDSETSGHAVMVPLRHEGEPVAVLAVERKSAPFTDIELQWLRLCADQVAPRLATLEARDAWFGKRAWRAFRKQAAKLIGVEHTGAKILGIIGVCALVFLLFGRWPHRVKGDFTLRSEVATVLPALFDGYLDEIFAEKGDLVPAGYVLARMDVRDLLIEQASAAADLDRYTREAEKARAEQALADMRMAEAMADQSRARLELVEHRLQQAEIRSPFVGAVVQGDHRERAGAPVERGEILFKVAALSGLTVEAEVDERDIDFVEVGAEANLVFASRPADPYAVRVVRIDPMAQSADAGNVFVVHCEIEADVEAWWRPGMTGVVRIEAGRRTPIWLLTRRTLDYLRLRWGW